MGKKTEALEESEAPLPTDQRTYDQWGRDVNAFTPIRHQSDGAQEKWSNLTGIDASFPVLVRAEFTEETKIENILKNFGVGPTRNMEYGREIDDRIDLQTAIMAIEETKRIYHFVPDELRGEFPTWLAVLKGTEDGSYQHALNELEKTKAETKRRQEIVEKYDSTTTAKVQEAQATAVKNGEPTPQK